MDAASASHDDYFSKPAMQGKRSRQQNECERTNDFLNKLPDCKDILKPSNVESGLFETSNRRRVSLEDLDNMRIPVVCKIPVKDINFTDEVLGKGSYGTVRKGSWSGTNVAIKSMGTSTSDPKYVIREVTILRQITHENLVSLMGVCYHNSQFHLIMELVDGHNLYDVIFTELIKRKYRLTLVDKNDIVKQLFTVIAFCHCHPRKLVHSDIKPANIMLTKSKHVKICDLGLSKVNELSTGLLSTQGGSSTPGTPMYMAPELILRSEKASQSSDIWSLACTIVELYKEEMIWRTNGGGYYALKNFLRQRRAPDLASVPQFLRDLISKCFCYDPNCRPTAETALSCFNHTRL